MSQVFSLPVGSQLSNTNCELSWLLQTEWPILTDEREDLQSENHFSISVLFLSVCHLERVEVSLIRRTRCRGRLAFVLLLGQEEGRVSQLRPATLFGEKSIQQFFSLACWEYHYGFTRNHWRLWRKHNLFPVADFQINRITKEGDVSAMTFIHVYLDHSRIK